MRHLPIFILLLGASSLGAMEAWRWTDKDGVVHFSDSPVPGAEKVELKSAPKPGSVAPPISRQPSSEDARPDTPFRYTSCSFTSPSPEEVFESVDTVAASIELAPGYRTGDRIEVTLNGQLVNEWPPTALGFLFTGLPRGNYQLAGRVMDGNGRTMCVLTGVTFNLHQPSLLTPGRAGQH